MVVKTVMSRGSGSEHSGSGSAQPPLPPVPPEQPLREGGQPEQLKVMLVGSRQAIHNTIHWFYALGVSEVRNWSPLMPWGDTGEFMSVLMRNLRLE